MRNLFLLHLLIYFFLITSNSFSQNDSANIYDLDLKELSKLKISTATKSSENLREISSTVFVITEAEIIDRGYFTLSELLSDLPGFQFRDILSFNSYVFQRGIPNQNNLILLLVDGVQINELNSGGFYSGGQFNLVNVERVEVVYGPASVAYGTNAISGIINIITKKVDNSFEINSTIGNFNTFESDVSYSYLNEEKDFGIRIAGMVKKTDKAELSGAKGDNNWTDLLDNFENDYSLDLKIHYKDFTFGTNLQQKKASAGTYIKSVGTNYKDYGTLWNIRFLNNYLKYSKPISNNLTFNSILYNRNATLLDNTIVYVMDTTQVGYYRPNNLIGLENVLNYKMNEIISLTGGLLLEYEWLAERYSITYSNSGSNQPPVPERPPMKNNYLSSLFFEPRISPIENLFISSGLRFDYSSFYDKVLTPSVGLSYNFKEQILRFSYSEAFRSPRPWDYSDGLGNSNLKPEKMRSYEIGLTLNLMQNLRLDITGYKNTFDNAITKEFIANSYKWVNSGKIKTDGIEFFASYMSPKLRATANYTYNQSIDDFGNFVPEISKHTANVSVTYILYKYLRFNLRANYVGERENITLVSKTNSKMIDPFLIFHGAISLVDYEGFTVQFIVKNIFDTEYYHTSNRVPERYRQPQRTFMLSVGYSFVK